MNVDDLTDDNFILYAAKNYDNPQCVTDEEFHADIRRVVYIKKLCTKYKEGKDVSTRLLVNHIIIMNNLFGHEPLVRMLWLKARQHFDLLLPILQFLNICPDYITNVGKVAVIKFDHIKSNSKIANDLKEI